MNHWTQRLYHLLAIDTHARIKSSSHTQCSERINSITRRLIWGRVYGFEWRVRNRIRRILLPLLLPGSMMVRRKRSSRWKSSMMMMRESRGRSHRLGRTVAMTTVGDQPQHKKHLRKRPVRRCCFLIDCSIISIEWSCCGHYPSDVCLFSPLSSSSSSSNMNWR